MSLAFALTICTALPHGRIALRESEVRLGALATGSLHAVAPALRSWPHTQPSRSLRWSVVAMAQPNKKGPVKTVGVNCAGCGYKLYKYRKGGKGSLVKCFIERIVEDHCDGKLSCPECGQEFARSAMIRGKPANKMIGGKVTMSKK